VSDCVEKEGGRHQAVWTWSGLNWFEQLMSCCIMRYVTGVRICVIIIFCAGAMATRAAVEEKAQLSDESLSPQYQHIKRVYTHLAWATYLRTAQRLSDAKEMYIRLLEDYEPSAFVHTQLAHLSRQLQNIKIAEQECRRAIEIQPGKPAPHFLLGQILVQRVQQSRRSTRSWEEPITEFQKVIELEPDHVEAHRILAEIAKFRKNYPLAIHAFKELTRIMPYYPQFYLELGSLYNRLQKKDDAIAAYERAVKVDRDLSQGYEKLGELYVKHFDQIVNQQSVTPEQLESAKESLEKAILAYEVLGRLATPENSSHYNALLMESRARLGSLYVELRKEEEAVEVLQQVLDTDSENVDANYWIGIAYQKLGSFESATPYLRKAITLAPHRVVGHYFALEQFKEVIDLLQDVLRTEPGNVDANYWTGLAYQGLGDFQKTEFYLREAISLDPEHEAALNALGYFFAENDTNLDEAVYLIKRALKKSPENAAYLDSLGWAYFKQGKLDKALQELKRAIHFRPENAEIQDHLGDAYMKMGLRKKAIAAWRRAVQLEPYNLTIQEKLGIYQARER